MIAADKIVEGEYRPSNAEWLVERVRRIIQEGAG